MFRRYFMRKHIILLPVFFIFFASQIEAKEAVMPTVAEVAAINGKLEIKREKGGWTRAVVKMPNYINDQLKTDAKSVADIEFLIGGHVGINENTVIEITGEREVKDITKRGVGQRIVLKAGAIWAKFGGQRQDLQFQTQGGVLAIKGTEFVIEENNNIKETKIYVLEGEVRYNTPAAQLDARAGDRITIPWEKVPVVKHYKPEELRKQCENFFPQLYETMKNILRFVEIAEAASGYSIPDYGARYYAHMAVEVIEDPNKAIGDFASSQVSSYIPGPFGSMIGQALRGDQKKKQKPKANFPYNLAPNQMTVYNLNPFFSWAPFQGADSYWIFVSPQEDMKDIYWAEQVYSTRAQYPTWAKSLKPSIKYYWRLIAYRGETPLSKASQTYFFCKK